MRDINRLLRKSLTGFLFLLVTGIGTIVHAQGRMTIQATAMGTSTQLGRIYNVNIHIEPLGRHIATPDIGGGEMKQLSRSIEEFLNTLPAEFDELVNCHDVHVRKVEHRILASCHCTMKGNLPITQIHDVTAALEDRVKERFPQVHRVTIHPEPFEG